MHQKLTIAALMVACPAFAFAAGQPPAVSAKPHPAPSAQATAAAGQAGAARIEACTNAAGAIIDNLEKGDAKAATADFDATMQANLSADKLAAAWQQVGSQFGKLQSRGTPQSAMYQGHTIVVLPLQFAKGGLNAQMACDADGKIAGFYMRPAAS